MIASSLISNRLSFVSTAVAEALNNDLHVTVSVGRMSAKVVHYYDTFGRPFGAGFHVASIFVRKVPLIYLGTSEFQAPKYLDQSGDCSPG